MTFKVVIPARYGSSRLPGKPLREIGGKPMIQLVYENAAQSGASEVIIATDDERVATVAASFGACVQLTSPAHQSGTERLAEVVARRHEPDDSIVVNLQGDEPMMPPGLIRQVADNLLRRDGVDITTLCHRIEQAGELFDPAIVKVVFDKEGNALYFSRAPIPWCRDAFAVDRHALPPHSIHFRHIGIYAYHASFLKEYARQPPCNIEQVEALEQLRALFHGSRIHVAEAGELPGPGVDTEQDLLRVRALVA